MEPWRIDAASPEEARRLLHSCCGSTAWVDRMMARRPFKTHETLLSAARDDWFALGRADWLEAFAQHPKIGDRDALQSRGATDMAAREQAGVAGAADNVIDALTIANAAYEQRFGHIFIVCATGKSADQMLELLQARLGNDPEIELRVAGGEQAKITEIRLKKL